MCSSAKGSSPWPNIWYSNKSRVKGFDSVSLAYASCAHLGLKVMGKLPMLFLLTGKDELYWEDMMK